MKFVQPRIVFQDTYSAARPPGIEKVAAHCLLAGHWSVREHELNRRRIQDAVLLFCAEGSGDFILRGRHFPITAGDIWYCSPFALHGYSCIPKKGWELWWVHFNGDNATQLCAQAGFSEQTPVLRAASPTRFRQSFDALLRTLKPGGTQAAWDASAELYRLLVELVRSGSRAPMEDSISACMDDECADLEELARKAGYSKYHYCRRFKAETGMSPWRYLTEQRLDRGARLLLETKLSVKEIAALLKFKNPDYFSRLFRERNGVSPVDFRGRTR